MNPIDSSYQTAVDKEANRVLKLSTFDFLKIEDYGTVETTINGNKETIAFWHYKWSNELHHVVFITERRVFLFFYKKYISGVKLDKGQMSILTDEETGEYD